MARKNWMRKSNKKRRAATRRKLGCEGLEDRRVLATLTVTSLADAGPGSLRDAIATSNTNGEADTIVFDSAIAGGTVSLTSGALQIGETGFATDITGSGETIDAGGASGVITVDDGDGYVQTPDVVVTISGLTVTGGSRLDAVNGDDIGGGIVNSDTLILDDVTVTGNTAAFGGGIANAGGLLTVTDSMITDNSGTSNGGGLYAFGAYHETSVTATTISGNDVGSQDGPYITTGGGVRVTDGLTTITDSTISGNTGDTTGSAYDYGGYGGNLFAAGYAQVNLIGSQLLNGTATNGLGDSGRGGNLQLAGYADVVVDDTTIDGGTASSIGGNILFGGNSLTITNNSVVSGGTGERGGGIYAFAGGAVIIDGGSTFSGNTATLFGGGVSVAPGGDVTLDAAVITGNTVATTSGLPWGGGAFVAGAFGSAPGVLNVTNGTLIDGNNAPGSGGGISGLPLGTANSGDPDVAWMNVNISDSTISNNYAGGNGGGVHTPRGGQLTVTGSTFSGNTAAGSGGALNSFGYGCGVGALSGVQASCAGTAGTGSTYSNITGSTFDNNSGAYGHIVGSQYVGDPDGDGVVEFFDGPSVVTITGSTLSNSTTSGGIDVTQSSLTLIESTVSGNDNSGSDGGGIGLFQFTGYGGTTTYFLNIVNSTITENTTDMAGGGIYASYYGQVDLTGTIVSGNTQGSSGDIYNNSAPYHTATDTIIGNADGTAFAADGVLIGDTASPVDALLGPLADNGGPTLTHMPLAGSPAIDANASSTSGADQRGAERPWDYAGAAAGGVADIGSVEAGSPVDDGLPCDFDGNGVCDGLDIDGLQAAAVAGGTDLTYDLNGDGVVDITDRDEWLLDAGILNEGGTSGYLLGDFNLDGSVDVSDFNLWNQSKFTTNSNWTSGDLNMDGVVDVSDFNGWNQNKFTSSSIVANDNFDVPRAAGVEVAGSNHAGAGLGRSRAAALSSKLTTKTTFEGDIANKADNSRVASRVQPLATSSGAVQSATASTVVAVEMEASPVTSAHTIGVNSVADTASNELKVNDGHKVKEIADSRLRVSTVAQAADEVFADLGSL